MKKGIPRSEYSYINGITFNKDNFVNLAKNFEVTVGECSISRFANFKSEEYILPGGYVVDREGAKIAAMKLNKIMKRRRKLCA